MKAVLPFPAMEHQLWISVFICMQTAESYTHTAHPRASNAPTLHSYLRYKAGDSPCLQEVQSLMKTVIQRDRHSTGWQGLWSWEVQDKVITQRKALGPCWGARREMGKELEWNITELTLVDWEKGGRGATDGGCSGGKGGTCLEGRGPRAEPGPGRKDNALVQTAQNFNAEQ